MIRAPGRTTSRSDTLLFMLCLLLSGGAMALPDRYTLALRSEEHTSELQSH